MLKNHPLLRTILFIFAGACLALAALGYWFFSLFPASEDLNLLKETSHEELIYLKNGVEESRGKVLAVVTSTQEMGESGKRTGYELTELSRAYYVFQANGFEVDVASPQGGKPPVVIDRDDMGAYDYAFLNDEVAMQKVDYSIPLSDVDGTHYQAVYFVGGKGAMYDFPENEDIKRLVRNLYNRDKTIGAVCHGPAALVNVTLDDGTPLLTGRKVSSFTNEEELLLIPEAQDIFPFLLEDKLVEQGAHFEKGPMYLNKISRDGNLITGQNPWSVWTLAESMVEQLGYTPIDRPVTGEENSIDILGIYESKGYHEARNRIATLMANDETAINRQLLAMHAIVALMQFDLGKSIDIVRLLNAAKI